MRSKTTRCLIVAMALLASIPARADEISVANYGSSISTFPWVIAFKKNFFKEFGANITGIYATQGGTSDVRAMMAGDLPYAETGPGAVIAANTAGAELRMISQNVVTTANFVWVTLPDSPIRALADIKGKKITFTSPNSTTHMLNSLLVEKAGLKPGDVTFISTGTYGAATTALESKGVDIALLAEPNYSLAKSKLRALVWSRDVIPAIDSTVGVTSTTAMKNKPETLRGIVRAREKAVKFLETNRAESTEILSKEFKLDPTLIASLLNDLLDKKTENVPFWGDGHFYPGSMDAAVKAFEMMKVIPANTQWRSLVDQSFLPDELKVDLNK